MDGTATATAKESSAKPKPKILWIVGISLAAALLLAALLFQAYQTHRLKKEVADLRWSDFVMDYNNDHDFMIPKVGIIQFTRHTHPISISFSTVDYTPSGLHLVGKVGNASQLKLDTVALQMVARPYPYKVREKWEKFELPWWSEEWNFGSGQVDVGTILPGRTVAFDITIPNVKQTADDIQIAVSLSGERYSYPYDF